MIYTNKSRYMGDLSENPLQILIPSCVLLAAIPGDYLGGWLADIYGRKIILIIGQIIIAFFGVLSAFCTTYISYLIVRCFVGFGFGIVVMLVIVQVAEICPTAYRATAVSVTFVMWAIGSFIFYTLNLFGSSEH